MAKYTKKQSSLFSDKFGGILKKFWIVIILFIILAGIFYWYILRDLPSPTKLTSNNNPQSTQIFDRNGLLLYTIYNNKNQKFLPLSKIPNYVQEATIAIEDKDYYHHGAIDPRGIIRAFISTVFHRQIQGGSTITQQLVKNSLLNNTQQTLIRKAREAILAFATELLYPKSKILELYLNQTPYGGTAYGIEAASETYFDKHAANLNLAQAALLAGLPQEPTTYSPFGAHPELAKQRQILVLKAMQMQGYISPSQEQIAEKEPLQYQQFADSIQAPHFSLYVKDLLIQKYGEKMVEEGGLSVTTSLDMNLQTFAQDAVASEMAKLKNAHVTNGAAMITKPGTGEILAMVGSRDYFDTTDTDGNVNVTIMNRQPGSSIKPINYAVGLMNGYTAATPFIDEPICFPNPGHKQYCPGNYDGKFHGVQTMRYSLGNSFNIPAVKMLKANGIQAMIATASAMGISTFTDANRYGLSLTLGGAEVTMFDMMQAYGVFANGGYKISLHPILKVIDHTGRVLDEYTPPPSPIFGKRVLSPGVAFIISNILSDNGARLVEFGSNSSLYIPKYTVSAKTGTTNDFRDNWTFGYTPRYVVGTWVGNNDNTPMGSIASGITGAAPIWHTIMAKLLQGLPDDPPQRPGNVIQKAICSLSGLLPPAAGPTGEGCSTRFEYFIAGTEPKRAESMENVWIDKSTQNLAKPGQTDNVEQKPELIVTDPIGTRYCATCNHPEPSPTPGK